MPRANVNGTTIYYEVNGQGEPLVMIMGFGGGLKGWYFQTRAFKRHYRVITFDNRGIGKSARATEPYTVSTMAADTLGLMDHLGVVGAHVLGMSLGSLVAQEIAIEHPERVMKLILACASIGEAQENDMHERMVKAFKVKEGPEGVDLRSVNFEEAMDTVIALSFNKKRYRMLVSPVSKVYMKLVGVNGHFRQIEAVQGYETLARLHRITAPTLVITGSADNLLPPKYSEQIASLIPGAKLVKVEGGSHALNIEMRHRFNKEVLDFLGGR
ncbi:MAG: alpha/beta hydrolase [Chloroflexi bacterium]|nr:alpha/beta hydrolase [Chloroflexota bacterium]